MIRNFLQELQTQRWDDHRYYHHSRINQSLHLVSAISFVIAYGLLFVDPAYAAILAWCVSMTTRQAGHFFFEPRGYDHVNQASDEFKEEIKVGYNIERKTVLMAVWAAIPLALWLAPALDDGDRSALAYYVQHGGTLLLCGQDLAWQACSPASPWYSAQAAAWAKLKSRVRLQ